LSLITIVILKLRCSNINGSTPQGIRGFRKDPWGFTLINFSRLIHIRDCEEHDPYIEVSQTEIVYYVNDEVNKD